MAIPEEYSTMRVLPEMISQVTQGLTRATEMAYQQEERLYHNLVRFRTEQLNQAYANEGMRRV